MARLFVEYPWPNKEHYIQQSYVQFFPLAALSALLEVGQMLSSVICCHCFFLLPGYYLLPFKLHKPPRAIKLLQLSADVLNCQLFWHSYKKVLKDPNKQFCYFWRKNRRNLNPPFPATVPKFYCNDLIYRYQREVLFFFCFFLRKKGEIADLRPMTLW